MVASLISAWWANKSCCATLAASSRSLLVIVPAGFEKVMSRDWTSRPNGDRQSKCCTSPWGKGTKWLPPMPGPAASCAPNVAGSEAGTSSAMPMGRRARSLASPLKSRRALCTPEVRWTRDPLSQRCLSTSWRMLKSPHPLGMAKTMERSSPTSFCHLLVLMQRCPGVTESKSSKIHSTRRGGSSTVIASLLTVQPRMILRVAQVASPFFIFLGGFLAIGPVLIVQLAKYTVKIME
jgi:hypothetical protein